jgi:hypothetical protein
MAAHVPQNFRRVITAAAGGNVIHGGVQGDGQYRLCPDTRSDDDFAVESWRENSKTPMVFASAMSL